MYSSKDFVVRWNVDGLSLQRFHFFDGIFLGGWYPKGLTAAKDLQSGETQQGNLR